MKPGRKVAAGGEQLVGIGLPPGRGMCDQHDCLAERRMLDAQGGGFGDQAACA